MKAIITGMSGMVAPAVARILRADGEEVVAWDRGQVSPDDPTAVERFIEEEAPDVFFQIATGSPDWIEQTARLCHQSGIRFLAKQSAEHGKIEASTRWIPSCAYLDDSAEMLDKRVKNAEPGLYQLGGNPGLNFHEIATRLNTLHGGEWTIVPTDQPDHDGRMLDERITFPPISVHLTC